MPELELARARSWSAECQGAYVPTFWRPRYRRGSASLGFQLGICWRSAKPLKTLNTEQP